MPLLNLDTRPRAPYERLPEYPSASEDDDDSVLDVDDGGGPPAKKKRWWMYLPLLLLVVLMFAPQYFILVMLVSYYLTIHNAPFLFTTHLAVIHLLTFLASCSLLVCVVRDPGAIRVGEDANSQPDAEGEDVEDENNEDENENEETDMMDALRMGPTTTAKKGTPQAFDDDFNAPHKWCRKCWAPKPERTHHCSACGRCVLKMDHHCPWLAQKCVGHWTYTAFLHFLLCVTLLSTYVGLIAGRIVYVAFLQPFEVDERIALHALFLTIYGAVFSLVVGSFFLWHVYLASTNQTTIENISPFLLLRYLPALPAPTAVVSAPAHTGITAPPSMESTGANNDNVSLNSPNLPRPLSLHPVSVVQAGTPPDTSNSSFPSFASQSFHRATTSRSSTPGPIPMIGPNTTVTAPIALPTSTPMTREYQLTASQRRTVRYYHGKIRLYDVGFVANWAQLLGVGGGRREGRKQQPSSAGAGTLSRWRWRCKWKWRGLVYRILCGGGGAGDGKTFPRNPKAEGLLVRLAQELAREGEDKID